MTAAALELPGAPIDDALRHGPEFGRVKAASSPVVVGRPAGASADPSISATSRIVSDPGMAGKRFRFPMRPGRAFPWLDAHPGEPAGWRWSCETLHLFLSRPALHDYRGLRTWGVPSHKAVR